jgi:hypothetical protein
MAQLHDCGRDDSCIEFAPVSTLWATAAVLQAISM